MTTPHPHAGAVVMLVLLALAAYAAAPAAAAPPAPKAATFALTAVSQSGALRLRGTPGRTLRGSVLVRSLSRRRITVRLQPAGIRNATNGNADYVTTHPSATARWLRLAASTVRLAPKASQRIAFSARIPAQARGASHYAGIVALDAADLAVAARDKKRKAKTFTISRISRQALPITIRLPGPLTRSLALRSVEIVVQPAGAGLVLGLRPGGNVLTQSASVRLRVSRGARTILRHTSTLGQLFPNSGLQFRVPWAGRPSEGSYRVRGVIQPTGAAPVYVDRIVRFTAAKVTQLERATPPVAQTTGPGLPLWVWLALTGAAALLVALSLAFWRYARRVDSAATAS
jgi:hypothetical protein